MTTFGRHKDDIRTTRRRLGDDFRTVASAAGSALFRHLFQFPGTDGIAVETCVLVGVHAEGDRHKLAVEDHRDVVIGAGFLVHGVLVHFHVLLAQRARRGDDRGVGGSYPALSP